MEIFNILLVLWMYHPIKSTESLNLALVASGLFVCQRQATPGGQQAPVAVVSVEFARAPLTELVCAMFAKSLARMRTLQGKRERRVTRDRGTDGGRAMMPP